MTMLVKLSALRTLQTAEKQASSGFGVNQLTRYDLRFRVEIAITQIGELGRHIKLLRFINVINGYGYITRS